jgi:Domain of unknown function (DUF4189)
MRGKVPLLASVLVALPLVVNAGGALSIGECNPEDGKYPFGYALNLYEDAATQQSLATCASLSPDGKCEPKLSFSGPSCLSLAIEKKGCGATGWANASNIPDAESQASDLCHEHGGNECLIAFANCSTVPQPDGLVLVPVAAAWAAYWGQDYWRGLRERGSGHAFGGGDPHGQGASSGRGSGSREVSNRGGTSHTAGGRTNVVHTTASRTSFSRVSTSRVTVNRGATRVSTRGRHPG